MNTTHMNEIGNGPILKEINKYGPWPLDDEGWNAETWNFKKALNKVTVDSPTFALFSLVIGLDSKDAEHYIFQVS